MTMYVNHRKNSLSACLIFFGVLVLASTLAHAEPTYNKPFYNPETKSYFELYSPEADDPNRKRSVRTSGHIAFPDAMAMASKRSYKGARGRLAIVKSLTTHEFLAKHLSPAGSAWIGLRYYCRFNKLMWVNGEIFENGKDFAPWSPRGWRLQGGSPRSTKESTCPSGRAGALPVHYWGMEDGFSWNANGYAKGFNAMIIEYPTGKP